MANPEFVCRILSSEEWTQWDNFVSRVSGGNIFQQSKFLRLFSEVFQQPVEILAIFRRNRLTGGLTCFPRRRLGLGYSAAPYFIPYNGVLLDPIEEISDESRRNARQVALLRDLLNQLQQRFSLVVVDQPDNLADLRPFGWNGWQCQPQYTVLVPLDDEKKMWEAVERDQRRKIRRLQEQGFTLREGDDVALLYALLEGSYRLHRQNPPLPQRHFLPFSRALLDNRLARLFFLQKDSKVFSALLMLEDAPRAYALFSGRIPHRDASGTEVFLMWQVLNHYRKRQFQEVDLLGAMVPSIAKIKLELGGRLLRYDRFLYFKNGLVEWLFKTGVSYFKRKRKIN